MTADRPLSTQLTELTEAIATASTRHREMQLEQERVTAKVAQISDEIVECHAAGDDVKAAKLSKTRARLETTDVREAGERVEGAQRAVQRAEVERSTFAAETIDQLLAERRPDAEEAARAVEEAIASLAAAQRQWDAVQSDHAAILRFAGRSTEGLPAFPQALHDLTRHARRAGQLDVPTPARR
jgi:chromosome segregation ATPase